MAHGGKRKGAGRPKGSPSKFTAEAREAAASTGKLPHEILLSIARGEPVTVSGVDEETGQVVERQYFPDLPEIIDAAKAAAPYYAPKFAQIQPQAEEESEPVSNVLVLPHVSLSEWEEYTIKQQAALKASAKD